MTNHHDHYLESEVQSAHPLKLVSMLYRGALESVAAARRKLATGDPRGRSRQITKAWEILGELSRALDHGTDSVLSGRLAALYLYMQTRLLEANSQQADAPLEEVQRLLSTLDEAWQILSQGPLAAAPPPVQESLSCTY